MLVPGSIFSRGGFSLQLLTIQDVSKRLKLSRRSIYRLQKDGAMPAAIRIGPRAARWKEADITDFVNSRPGVTERTAAE